MKAWETNLEMLEIVSTGLKEMLEEICFIGGATTGLYLEPSHQSSVRSTEDVDCVIELASYTSLQSLERRLEKMGFAHSMTQGSPICRWIYQGIKVDVMPAEGNILGFSNRWYPTGMLHARKRNLPSGRSIKIFTLPCFLASKLDAFNDRGRSDYYASKDMEDVITLLDGCANLHDTVSAGPPEVKDFLFGEFQKLLADEAFLQSLSGHLANFEDVPGRSRRLLDILRNF